MTDTDAATQIRWLQMLEDKPPGQHLADILDLCETSVVLLEAGLRRDYPEASDREIFLRSAEVRLGADLCRKVYGWAPHTDGHKL